MTPPEKFDSEKQFRNYDKELHDTREYGKYAGKDSASKEYKEFVVKINRCATVVKGGRRFSFSALVVVGDQKGKVGIGFGKANEVPQAVQKAVKDGRKNLLQVPLQRDTIPHEIMGHFRATKVLLKPAPEGTGVIAGAPVRAIVEAVGVKDILTKAYGSTNAINLSKAALDGLKRLRSYIQVMQLRGIPVKTE